MTNTGTSTSTPFTIILLVGLYTVLSFLIIGKTYCDKHGYLSPDAASYLALADNIVDGKGFYVRDYLDQDGFTYASKWPVGYACLISGAIASSNLSSRWASKLVNLLLIALSFLLLYCLFKQDAWLYALLFFNGALLELHTHTWSEVPFIFGLLWYAFAMYKWDSSNKKRWLLHLTAAGIWLFLSRYIGAFIVITTVAFVAFYVEKKQYKKASYLLGVATIISLFVIAYLHNNNLHTSYGTGMMRHNAHESSFILLKYLFGNQIFEFNFVAINDDQFWIFIGTSFLQLLLVVPLIILLKQHFASIKMVVLKALQNKIVLIFLVVGSSYWLAIVGLRWFKLFAMFSYRTLSPATFMFYIALLTALLSLNIKEVMRPYLSVTLSILASISIVVNGPDWNNPLKYNTYISQVTARYTPLPTHSLIAFGNYHIKYLFPHFSETLPQYLAAYHESESPTLKQEKMNDFLVRLQASNAQHIFIAVDERLKPFHQYHESIYTFMKTHKGEGFYQVK